MVERNIRNLKYLPVFTFMWLVITFLVSYAIAASLGHVYAVWPYISDTGTTPPESCVFGLMLNIGSFLMCIVIYVRYHQIKLILQTHDKYNKILNIMNVFCVVVGALAAFGACIVANFQETSNMPMHLVGANLCFGVGSFYFVVHTIMCFFIEKDKFALSVLRAHLCVLYATSFATTLIFAKMAFQEYNVDARTALEWDPDKPGYDLRLASTFSEWVLAICQGLYILSFSYDFRTIGYQFSFSLMDSDKEYKNSLRNEIA